MKEQNLVATLQKSYYGKARVREEDGETILRSYNTDVCKVTAEGGFVRMWGGYSRTTMNHINDFRIAHGFPKLNKAGWDALPRLGGDGGQYSVTFSNGFVTWTAGVRFDNAEDAEAFGDEVVQARNNNLIYWVD